MKLDHVTKGNCLIITPNIDRLDAKNTGDFKTETLHLIEQVKIYRVIIDLQQLNFIDSSGVGVFLALLRFLSNKGGELKISSITQPVRTTFELVSLHKIIEVYTTPEEALDSFKIATKVPKFNE